MMGGFYSRIRHGKGGRMRLGTGYVLFVLVFGGVAISTKTQNRAAALPGVSRLESMSSRFAPTPLRVDTSKLSSGDRSALAKLIEAARILNDVFLRQVWSGNPALYSRLQRDATPLGKARLHYFWLNKGPWSDIDAFQAFLPGVPARKPAGANFYPEDMTRQDFSNWVAALPEDGQKRATGFFSVIRWQDSQNPEAKNSFPKNDVASRKELISIPYSEEYKPELTQAASLLREAALLTDNASLKKFLGQRADAFLSNDYYDSDLSWMDLDAPLDITIGPYETYNDEIFGYKAAFEAYVNVRDEEETSKLGKFTGLLQRIEDNLPVDPRDRNPKLGSSAVIQVVDEILATGDAAHGVQTAAYNLPNDERVVQQKGSKRVMLKNVQEAKFRSVLLPIARKTLSKAAMVDVNFELFFTHILAHELMHGLGPHQISIQGRATNARSELKELYSAIEEAKADVTGLFALQYMMDHAKELGLAGTLPADNAAQRQLYTTYLASSFRTLRFGLNDAHGKGMAMQFNFFTDQGAYVEHADGIFTVDIDKMKSAVAELDHDLLTLEAQGDYDGARKMLDELGVVRPTLKKALDSLQDIPTDIEPIFVTAAELAAPAKPPGPGRVRLRRAR
jgi:hypothetical protein